MTDYQIKLKKLAKQLRVTEKQLEQDIVYLRMCFSFSSLSKAKRLQVGEFFVTKHGVVVPGYNGTAPGTSNDCEYVDKDTKKLVSYHHVICGAQNCVYKAAREGVPLVGSTMYSTDSPCGRCAPMIISVQAKRVVYCRKYRIVEHLRELEKSGIIVQQIPYEMVFPEEKEGFRCLLKKTIKSLLPPTWQR